jgi:hydroxymethylglutaryl-CoA lyase
MSRPVGARLIEVGPRDGLQNEKTQVSTADKVALIDLLSRTGVDEVELTAFVSPRWVPQLADASAVCAQIQRQPGVVYSALVPNMQGWRRAESAGLDKISLFTAASDGFTQKNVNASVATTFERMQPVAQCAKAANLLLRGYISCAFWCPYEGPIAPQRVLEVGQRLIDLGVDELSLGDTIGKATPSEVRRLLDLLLRHLPASCFSLHCHDTYGRALANVQAAVELGIAAFDASVGGLGGCPYAPGASGNVSTARVVRLLQRLGRPTSVRLPILRQAAAQIGAALKNPSKLR